MEIRVTPETVEDLEEDNLKLLAEVLYWKRIAYKLLGEELNVTGDLRQSNQI